MRFNDNERSERTLRAIFQFQKIEIARLAHKDTARSACFHRWGAFGIDTRKCLRALRRHISQLIPDDQHRHT
jgi:uncharacterized protein YjhX (UPF0386 family)